MHHTSSMEEVEKKIETKQSEIDGLYIILQDTESEPEYEEDTLPPKNSKATEAEVEILIARH